MSTKKELRSARSKSSGRQPSGVPLFALPNAHQTKSTERKGRSPARTGKVPTKVNNTEKVQEISPDEQVSPISKSQQTLSEPTDNHTLLNNSNGTSQVSPVSEDTSTPTLPKVQVSDNKVPPQPSAPEGSGAPANTTSGDTLTGLSKEDPGKALLLVLQELREIKTQMVKLGQMESTTASLVEQLASTVNKTGELEKTAAANKSDISSLNKELKEIKTRVDSQDSKLVKLQNLEDDITESSEKTIAKMNDLIDTQREQVDSFNSGAKLLQKEWKREVMAEVNKKLESMEREREKERYYQKLKDQAFRNRQNLILIGLPEDAGKTTTQIVQNFFSETLKTQKVKFTSTHRLGNPPQAGSTYARPVLVKFSNWVDKKLIWQKRADITNDKDGKKVRIHADLPKALREGVPILYKVANAAAKIKEFANAKVNDYQLELNGKTFQISDLEQLPVQIRPSTLAAPKSDTHLVFYSRQAKLSNHYPSSFTVKGQSFSSMEHYLATKKAELSGREDLIQKAREVQDPIQAKYILNVLHEDHQQEWDQNIEEVAMEGLRAKFSQSRPLHDYLCNTGKLTLGEASTNARWGIGMDINNPDVLDQSKWSKEGNLLGRLLMNLRNELPKKKKKVK